MWEPVLGDCCGQAPESKNDSARLFEQVGCGELKNKQRETTRQQEVKEQKYLSVELKKVWIPQGGTEQ